MPRTLLLPLLLACFSAMASEKKLCVETKTTTFCFDKTEKLTCEVVHNTSEKLCAELGGIFEESSADCFLCYQ